MLVLLIFGTCFAQTGSAWADNSSPVQTGASPVVQTIQTQTGAVAQTAQSDTQTTTPATTPAATTTPPANATNVPVTEVEVTAEKPKPGSAEAGYKVEDTTTTGPLGKMKLQDTPYSINVMTAELIENVVAQDPYQLMRMNPLVQAEYPQDILGNSIANLVSIRGFEGTTSFLVDGLYMSSPFGRINMIDKEAVEVLNGPTAFLYGGGSSVGGAIDFVLKRPTAERYDSITVGDYGGGQAYVHGDFGGPIDKNGIFGYRLNILAQPWDDTSFNNQQFLIINSCKI